MASSPCSFQLTVIGCGAMGQALLSGILAKGLLPSKDIHIIEKPGKDLSTFSARGVRILSCDTPDTWGLGSEASASIIPVHQIYLLAVKPQVAEATLANITPHLPESSESTSTSSTLVSVMAGTSCDFLKKLLPNSFSVVRAMPNLGASCSESMTGMYFAESTMAASSKAFVEALFSAVGSVLTVESETMIDAVTAVAGSGPAYFYKLIEALQQSALELGFSESESQQLVVQTAKGALKYLEQSGEDASVLRKRVTSPGGTTEAALLRMDEGLLTETVKAGVHAAFMRAQELAK